MKLELASLNDGVNGAAADQIAAEATATGAAITLHALGHRYKRNADPVLDGIDLSIKPGELVALIGRSGSGKSTLLHLISGLTKPTDGAVRINGNLVERPNPEWVVMFQAPSLFPWMTVARNAGVGLKFSGRKAEAAARVPEVLDLVDLTEFADRNVQDLSGGQQQRVALARSLAVSPRLLMLDEPFSALDIFTRRTLQVDVRRIAKQLGLTLILVTHDVSEAVLMADRAVLLTSSPGRVGADTPIELSTEDRDPNARAFQREATRLRTLYTEIAGLL